jgi:tRNA (guanine-N7-)-methyltransferase
MPAEQRDARAERRGRLARDDVGGYRATMRPESERQLARRHPWNTGSVLLEVDCRQGPLDLAAVFGNGQPVELEIGIGKGTFLLARAKARPELNFLGLEYAGSYGRYAADRARRAGLENVRIACTEAGEFVRTCLPEASLWRVHIYFPDPWPKRRHHRRRLIQPAFLEHIRRGLLIGGQLLIVTDHMDYFAHIQRSLSSLSSLKNMAAIPLPPLVQTDEELVGTNFERKYIRQGRRFYSVARMRYR